MTECPFNLTLKNTNGVTVVHMVRDVSVTVLCFYHNKRMYSMIWKGERRQPHCNRSLLNNNNKKHSTFQLSFKPPTSQTSQPLSLKSRIKKSLHVHSKVTFPIWPINKIKSERHCERLISKNQILFFPPSPEFDPLTDSRSAAQSHELFHPKISYHSSQAE